MSEDVRAYVADFYRFDNLKDSGSYNYKGKQKLDILFHRIYSAVNFFCCAVAFPGIHQFVAEGKFILLSSSKTHERFPVFKMIVSCDNFSFHFSLCLVKETRGLNVSEDGGESWNMVRLPEAAQNDVCD